MLVMCTMACWGASHPDRQGGARPPPPSEVQEAGEMVDAVAGAMAHVGVAPHGRAAMFGANSPELMIALQAGNRGTQCQPAVHAWV